MSSKTPAGEPASDGSTVLSADERKKRYKKSLNLPKTSFPMRANLAQNEPRSQKRWKKEKLYQQIQQRRADADTYVFHDGPPYANGDIHVGHLLNKVLKDIVVRSSHMEGLQCDYIPGWDCHGLPIEHKVLQGLVEKGKMDAIRDLDEDVRRMAVRRECARYAGKYVKTQSQQMQRLLTQANYDQPYLTMQRDYEAGVLEVFADLVDEELIYRSLKPVHWSIANETALAEAELEYQDREDPSIYVLFRAADSAAVARIFDAQVSADVSFMIWTTTPWTLPANRLIAVHEDINYSLVHYRLQGQGLQEHGQQSAEPREVLAVVADDLVEPVGQQAEVESFEVLGHAPGSRLVNLRYLHPFLDDFDDTTSDDGRVVTASYVTLDDGTGLVHTAPGHGQEDYQTGLREGIEVYCPVRGDGTYDDTVPQWIQGVSIWDANELIVNELQRSGSLFHHLRFVHSYPHDWRSKTPVIFRATEQWFIAVDQPGRQRPVSLRDAALQAAEESIDFVPKWGEKRLRGMLESRPDWCISRQRAWGLPIPAFRRADGSIFLTVASVRAVAEAFRRKGSDAWFEGSPEELLESYDAAADPQAPEGLEISGLTKLYDIFDVWFESGSSWNAVLRQRDLGFPADLYLEGSDQHRGWFQLSLLPALGVTGQPPFRRLLTHGFIVDKDGRKMSKSLGNALVVDDLLKQYGADVCRWWVSSLAYEVDIKVDLGYFNVASESYRKVRNTLRFLLSNLADFNPQEHALDLADIEADSIDGWALQQATDLGHRVREAYSAQQMRSAHLALFDFCNDTLSSVYLDAVKDRLYCDRPDSRRRRRTQSTLHHIAELLCTLLAPILPHTADEAWEALHGSGSGSGSESVHLATHPPLAYQASAQWAQVLETRDRVLKALEEAKGRGLENSLDAGVALQDDGALAPFGDDLADLFGVSRVELTADGGLEIQDLREQPRCERSWRRDATVSQRSDGGFLSDRDAEAVGLA
ncbi:MAG: isoleucine--tRNA ligase [Acidobacteriota bacterium]